MTFWTSDRVRDALQPAARLNLPRGPQPFARVWTDTRTIASGDLFVALAGERFDAHDFLEQAVASGAAGVVRPMAEEHLEGLGDLAGVMREELAACEGVATAVVPSFQPDVVAEARRRARHVLAAGLESGDLRAEGWELEADGRGRVIVDGVEVRVPLRGLHNLR